ncbi:hypothetical protein F5Y15DRAFT_45304 [Xylariaceae sp. FL0016]|nr:hypothetical protein F5Y15DRAFT_45304 [Xylariaceae sp. FL0016]
MTRERDAKTRRFGLAKKADTYSRLFAANAVVIIQDEGQLYLYTSSPKFLPELISELKVLPENTFEPDVFESVHQRKRRSPSPTSSSSSKEILSRPQTPERSHSRPVASYTQLRRPEREPSSPPPLPGLGASAKDDTRDWLQTPTKFRAATPQLTTPSKPPTSPLLLLKNSRESIGDKSVKRLLHSAYFK